MLKHISKINGLGVFDGYTEAAGLQPFRRYNVIYGENGSGKTTLSRLFGCLSDGRHTDYPGLEFVVESESGQLTQGVSYSRKVRVFNSDYIEANIGRLDGPLRHILILGEENKSIAEELRREIAIVEQRNLKIREIDKKIEKANDDKGKVFSQIAKTIGEATSGASLRAYRKPDAERAYARVVSGSLLAADELELHRATVRQEQMAAVAPLATPQVSGLAGDNLVDRAGGSAHRAMTLIGRSAQSATIARLVENAEIAAWVETGVHLHQSNSSDHCEFCRQRLPASRIEELAAHFSEEDQKLKSDIDAERSALQVIIASLKRFSLPDKMAFYSELRGEYEAQKKLFWEELDGLVMQLTRIDSALAEKLTLRTKSYDVSLLSDTSGIRRIMAEVSGIIARQNTKTEEFDQQKGIAREAIERHYLLTITAQVDEFVQLSGDLAAEKLALIEGGEGLDDVRGIDALNQSIIAKRARVSDAHAGGQKLTEHLRQFLGRTDLRFESSSDGYSVLRRGKPARRLSEGERTAVAFLYFLVQLKEQAFNIEEGVVVIDDPISSLDASAIYQAFSFLKNDTNSAKQLFILTHNFEFLKLVINWLTNLPSALKKDCGYFMVLCSEGEDGRNARIAPLDKLLIEHATEYHYLFKVLSTFTSDGTILGCYHVPNIARKVLETFLDFHLPSNDSLYRKLDEVNFDPHKKTAIYKFSNDLSHFTGKGFDPAIVAETQKNVRYLLEMIEAVEPLHYRGLARLAGVAGG